MMPMMQSPQTADLLIGIARDCPRTGTKLCRQGNIGYLADLREMSCAAARLRAPI
jgi:hypothetical protein